MEKIAPPSADWSFFPEGIVAKIADAALARDVRDYISLRRVCSTWRHDVDAPISSDGRFRPHNWILLHPVTWLPAFDYDPAPAPATSHRLCSFLNFSSGRRASLHLPQLQGHVIRACVDGLLLLSHAGNSDAPARLLNPFTGAITDYPTLSRRFFWPSPFLSLAFASPAASTLMAVTKTEVAYADPGWKDWKFINNCTPHGAGNLALGFFQGFSYVFSVTRTRQLVQLSLTRFKLKKAHPDEVEFGTELFTIAQKGLAIHIGWDIVSLVESDGELLLLSRSHQTNYYPCDFFLVFKVIFEEGLSAKGKANLVPVSDFGKHVIFINRAYGGLSISTDVIPSFKPNSIYCYHGSSLTVYHPEGLLFGAIDSCIPSGWCCYHPVEKKQFTRKSISVFPQFGSRLGKRRRSGR